MCFAVKIEPAKARAKAAKAAREVINLFGEEQTPARFYARSRCPVITLES